MVDELEEKPGEGLNLQKYFDVIRRRHMYFLIPFFLGWLAVWSASWVLPSRYKSGTLILVEQPSMPKDYVTPNISDDLQARLASITQQILSRTRLLHIIQELNLYPDKRGHLNDDELVESMRKDIDIELVKDVYGHITSFNIFYSSHDPHIAQQVTGELTNLFISENLEMRQQKSEDTTKFLEQQLEAARQNLAEQEEKVRIYKDQHLGELPSQLNSNVQILSGLQSQLQSEEDGLNADRQQNAYLQSMLEQSRALERTSKSGDSTPVGIPALDQELEKLRAQLADLSSHYTDRHPDVRKLKDQIAKTEKMRDQALVNLKAGATTTSGTGNQPAATEDDLGSTGGAATIQLQGQLKSNQIDMANKEHEIAALKAKIDGYQSRLNEEPAREQQFADLTRGYEQSKANYDDLLKKKNSSQMATSMELLQQGEHFQMIDPPSLPAKPDFPNRLKFCGIGLGIGIALGGVLAGGMEFLDDRLYDEKALKDLLPIAVISEIPPITSPSEERRQERKLWMGWVTAGIVFATVLAGSAISFLRG
jgi:polysaccharide chain length determinant protein (PEP-CTERM system associated)